MEKKTLVLDASVVVKWYSSEEGADRAMAIRDLFRHHKVDIAVPQLLFYEFANALRFNKALSPSEKAEIIENLYALELTSVPPTDSQMRAASDIAHKLNATVYDSAYLALARELNATYVTADDEFVKRATSRDVVALRNWTG